jgi:hypothetical protein
MELMTTESDAELLHRPAVHAGPEVVADHEGGDARLSARLLQLFQFLRQFLAYFTRDGLAVDDLACHFCLPF